ncbi:MAG: hypothetical protein ACYTJ0_19410 [Planctomycetota bacterium]|jgi:hypothetical protein
MRTDELTIRRSILAAAAAMPLAVHAAASAGVPIRLNEIRIDKPNNAEYVELAGPSGASLDGLTFIVIGDGGGADGTIEEVTSLTGQALNPNGLFFMADDGDTFGAVADLITSLNLENGDNVTMALVAGFTGALNDDLDTDDDGVLDVTPWSAVLDAVGLIESPNPPSGTEFSYGAALGFEDVGPDPDNGDRVPNHVYRCTPDGLWTIGPFDGNSGDAVDSPGQPNAACSLMPTLALVSTPPDGGWDPGDTVLVELQMLGLDELEAAGFQAFLQFDCYQLELESGTYTSEPFGLHILSPIADLGNGRVDLAAGIDQFSGQQPTGANAVLAVLEFTALQPVGVPDVAFRPNEPPTRLSDQDGLAIEPIDLLGAACPEDVNHDGEVNVDDLIAVILAWGSAGCGADVNYDGTVDVDDLLAVILAWGPCPS